MRHPIQLKHEFVEHIPDELAEGVLYVSFAYATVTHKCCCGCGHEVVTPLSPTDWQLIFDGETISLQPSIGNWSLDCKSHYWVRRNQARWAAEWSDKEIQSGRMLDRRNKANYYGRCTNESDSKPSRELGIEQSSSDVSLWHRIRRWFHID